MSLSLKIYRFTWVAPHHSLPEPRLLHRVRHVRVHRLRHTLKNTPSRPPASSCPRSRRSSPGQRRSPSHRWRRPALVLRSHRGAGSSARLASWADGVYNLPDLSKQHQIRLDQTTLSYRMYSCCDFWLTWQDNLVLLHNKSSSVQRGKVTSWEIYAWFWKIELSFLKLPILKISCKLSFRNRYLRRFASESEMRCFPC